MEQLTQCFWNKWRTHSEDNSVTHNVPSLREELEPRASLLTSLCFCLLKGIRLHHSLPQSWLWDLWSLVQTENERHKRTFFWLSWFFFKPFLFLNNHILCLSPSLPPSPPSSLARECLPSKWAFFQVSRWALWLIPEIHVFWASIKPPTGRRMADVTE